MTVQITVTLSTQDGNFYSERVLAKGISSFIQLQLEGQRDKIEEKHGEGSAYEFSISHTKE